MSEITVTVRDARRAVHTHIHASRVDYLVAGLSADPETIEELQAALGRFMHSHSPRGFFDHWSPGVDVEPWDAGVCVIDLEARLVALESTYSQAGPRGDVEILIDDKRASAVSYHLAEDWLFQDDIESWEHIADKRAKARRATPPLDARAVLYGKVCEYIVQACTEELVGADEAQIVGEGGVTVPSAPSRLSDIHARWLTLPRADLHGRSPRDLLLERRSHLVWDLQDRCEQWSIFKSPPPALSKESFAYRYGGFGTHEIVLYYYMIRYLLEAYQERLLAEGKSAEAAVEISWLEALQQDWLHSPEYETVSGRTPISVIERERIRLPEAMTGEAAMIDHDCPMCRAMADMPGPMFWHLDGCNFDPGFAFSFHRTREEWEAEEREYEEFSRKMDLERETAKAASPWKTSYSDPYALDGSPTLALYALAGHLGELTQNLKEAGAPQSAIDELNRAFDNVREVASPLNADLLEPVVEKMCDSIDDTTRDYPSMAMQAEDLEHLLNQFARRQVNPPEHDELPF